MDASFKRFEGSANKRTTTATQWLAGVMNVLVRVRCYECSADQATTHPPGVKASKQKNKAAGKVMFEFQRMWDIKKEDLTVKERLSKMKLLDSLIAKQELAEYEEALKKKFINELFSD
ncbi:hypothetical protein DY000_02054251 [Brassica cretica]|uniref:No apical meristem-associated C-terminal domain-containing protein n=1 Tax=Brassica cretica TaxID=69181 RepID=A0ABQ7AGS7_BRACR|nr:hypothetical protein DY000_02054251 [Brassica cretica]